MSNGSFMIPKHVEPEAKTSLLRVTPSSLIDRLQAIQDVLGKSYMEIGDIANELFVISQANNLPYTFVQLCAFVGEYVDRSYGSVMDYALCASFFNQNTRERYESLPFSHFQVARSFSGTDENGTPLWRVALETSLDYSGTYGRPPSRSKLISLLEPYRAKSVENYHYERQDNIFTDANRGSQNMAVDLPDIVKVSVAASRSPLQDEDPFENPEEDRASLARRADDLYVAVRSHVSQLASIFADLSRVETALYGSSSPILSGLARTISSLRALLEVVDIIRGEIVTGTYVSVDEVLEEDR